jgi:hypothetical protein
MVLGFEDDPAHSLAQVLDPPGVQDDHGALRRHASLATE